MKKIRRMLLMILGCLLLMGFISASAEQETETFVLTFVGDCTLGALPSQQNIEVGIIRTVGTDYSYPFRNVAEYFRNDDATFINLEGPLTDEGYPADKTYPFRGPTDFIHILTENSIDMASLANNHTMDYGKVGYESTIFLLQEHEIPYVEQDCTLLMTLDRGLKVGVYGMTYYSLDAAKMKAGIASLREQGAELVIVAPHWGYEGNYRANDQQKELAHAAIDGGADIVWGSHPHVLQPVEEYGDGIIYYSMANFCFGGNGKPDDFDTALLQQKVIRHADGRVELGELKIVPCSISSSRWQNNFQPTPLEPGTAEYDRVISKLDGSYRGANLKV